MDFYVENTDKPFFYRSESRSSTASTDEAAAAATTIRLLFLYARSVATRVPATAEIIEPVEKKIAGTVITESTEYGT